MPIPRLIALCFGLALAFPAFAEDAPYADKLLGDVGGYRSQLADQGVEIGLDYSATLWRVTDGGVKEDASSYLDLITLSAAFDGEKLFGIKGNTAALSLIESGGKHVNSSTVGSLQGIDNLEVTTNALRLYEAWVNQEFLDGRLALLVGLHDLNGEFAVTQMTDNFLKPSMQIGQSFAQSGRNAPSVFPTTSLAGRVRFSPTDDSYIAAAVYDGVPGDTRRPRRSGVKLDDKDGLLLIGEMGYAPHPAHSEAQLNKLALGFWNYTAGLDDFTELDADGNAAKSTARGVYVLSSYQFYHDAACGCDVGAFFRGGVSDGDTAQADYDYEVGIVANGWVPTRPQGQIGAGLSTAHNSDKYMESVSWEADRSEYSYELYYRDQLASGVSIQPDLQYIVNPGMDRTKENVTVIGMRVDVNF